MNSIPCADRKATGTHNEIIIEAYSCLGAHVKRVAAGLHEVGYFLISSYLLGTDSNVHVSKRKEASYFPYALVKQKIKHHQDKR
jgi:hypothetical protein